jgi:hypothetical protein
MSSPDINRQHICHANERANFRALVKKRRSVLEKTRENARTFSLESGLQTKRLKKCSGLLHLPETHTNKIKPE